MEFPLTLEINTADPWIAGVHGSGRHATVHIGVVRRAAALAEAVEWNHSSCGWPECRAPFVQTTSSYFERSHEFLYMSTQTNGWQENA
jgi:hypothetical protein